MDSETEPLQSLATTMEEVQAQLYRLGTKLRQKQNQIAQAEQVLADLRAEQNQSAKIEKALRSRASQLETANQALLHELQGTRAQLENAQTEIQQFRQTIADITKQRERSEAAVVAKARIWAGEQINAVQHEAKNQILAAEKRTQSAIAELAALRAEIANTNIGAKNITEVEAVLVRTRQDVAEGEKAREALWQELLQAQHDLKASQQELARLKHHQEQHDQQVRLAVEQLAAEQSKIDREKSTALREAETLSLTIMAAEDQATLSSPAPPPFRGKSPETAQ